MADRALQNFVNGKYADASDGRTSDVIDPSTGEVYAQAPVSSRQDVDAAMQAAAAAFDSSARPSPPGTDCPWYARARTKSGSSFSASSNSRCASAVRRLSSSRSPSLKCSIASGDLDEIGSVVFRDAVPASGVLAG